MSRKHFRLIAQAIRELMESAQGDNDRERYERVVFALADVLPQANPRFSRLKFLTACGLPEYVWNRK